MQQGITKWNVTTKDEADSCYTPNLSIPSKVGGQTVKIIGAFVFNSNQLTSVTIPSSVTSIEAYAFDGNVNLNNIIMQGRTSTAGMTLGFEWNGTGTVVFAP